MHMLSGALLGAGNIARNGHLPAYLSQRAVRERLRIVAVADLCPENLAAVSALLPDVRAYADPVTLLEEEQPDFVDICTPPYAHRALIEMAATAGCHIVCEKPLTADLSEALSIRTRLQGRGLVVFPCHQYHYAPQWQAIRQTINAGDIGAIRVAMLDVQRVGANPGNSAWQPAWRTDAALAGGGILVDHGTHLFYQLHDLFGSPQTITCRTERRLPGYRVDDTATVHLRYPGRVVRMRLTWAATARKSTHRYLGTSGEVTCLDDAVRVRGSAGDREIRFADSLSKGSAHSDWFAPLLVEFAERIMAGDHRSDRLDEAVRTAAYITLSYASAAAGGRPVAWHDPVLSLREDTLVAAD